MQTHKVARLLSLGIISLLMVGTSGLAVAEQSVVQPTAGDTAAHVRFVQKACPAKCWTGASIGIDLGMGFSEIAASLQTSAVEYPEYGVEFFNEISDLAPTVEGPSAASGSSTGVASYNATHVLADLDGQNYFSGRTLNFTGDINMGYSLAISSNFLLEGLVKLFFTTGTHEYLSHLAASTDVEFDNYGPVGAPTALLYQPTGTTGILNTQTTGGVLHINSDEESSFLGGGDDLRLETTISNQWAVLLGLGGAYAFSNSVKAGMEFAFGISRLYASAHFVGSIVDTFDVMDIYQGAAAGTAQSLTYTIGDEDGDAIADIEPVSGVAQDGSQVVSAFCPMFVLGPNVEYKCSKHVSVGFKALCFVRFAQPVGKLTFPLETALGDAEVTTDDDLAVDISTAASIDNKFLVTFKYLF